MIRKYWKLILVFSVLVGFVCICSSGVLVGALFSPSAPASPAATQETVLEQPTTIPTAIPTEIPTEAPTTTPAPTATRWATSTPDSMSVDKYANQMASLGEDFVYVFLKIADLSGQASDDPYMVLSTAWRADMMIQIIAIEDLADKVSQLDPPILMEPSHAKFVEATEHYVQAAQYLRLALDENEINDAMLLYVQKAGKEIADGNEALYESTALIPD